MTSLNKNADTASLLSGVYGVYEPVQMKSFLMRVVRQVGRA